MMAAAVTTPRPPLSTSFVPHAVRRAPPARLVLFVGEAIRPDAELAALLARDGIRALTLAGVPQALRTAPLARFDAALLDGALVDGPASRAIGALGEALGCPLVVVGERADEVDEIVALELGADVWLPRPVAPRRLRAHLAALLRPRRAAVRAPAPPAPALAGWTLDPLRGRLRHAAGREIELTPVQTNLLQCLFEAPGQLVQRARLMAALPHGERLSTRSVDVYVHRLRQRLAEQGVHELSVQALRGRGYTLVERRLAVVPAAA